MSMTIVASEISHNIVFRKRFYDQVFELLDGSSGGVVVDSLQLHNPVKHCGLSSRRSRVQIPAGALHNRRRSMIITHTLSPIILNSQGIFVQSSAHSIISESDVSRIFFCLITSDIRSNA
jgi:hypothetical protein